MKMTELVCDFVWDRRSLGVLVFVILFLGVSSEYELNEDPDLPWIHPTRLRHSRHSDHLKYTMQNHKPIFTNCSLYHPTIKEELEYGAFVIQVQAEDRDPPESGGTIKYSLMVDVQGEKKKFNIEAQSGIITTAVKFDRDEPAREKEVYITVRATDNGQPSLDGVCTLKIVIEDINDNKPAFDKASYLESVPLDQKVGSEVMRISATDIDDGNNSIVVYKLTDSHNGDDRTYFNIDPQTGVITLNKTIDKPIDYKFEFEADVSDLGEVPQSNHILLNIQVVSSNKKHPKFKIFPTEPIYLPENFHDFTKKIVTLQATSDIPDNPEVLFELLAGKTEQTNKKGAFILDSAKDFAYIKIAQFLDYEKITDYTLTVRVRNNHNLAAETKITIIVEDVNDNIPYFTEVTAGSVAENEPAGSFVMQVKAIDADGTSKNNQVRYELKDNTDLFKINGSNGNITTLVEFDREFKDAYFVKVAAIDNSPSSIVEGGPNVGYQTMKIAILDKNDNPPKFTEDIYVAESVPEDANGNFVVAQVIAKDNDTDSRVVYEIMKEGNIGDAFRIENGTGIIRVKNSLDYETITSYELKVRASDGIHIDTTTVKINIDNVNDNPPKFLGPYNATIMEEELRDDCIVTVEAYDPDIANRSAPQRIAYNIVKDDQKKLMSIDANGCLRLTKPLNRDPPTGSPTWQVLVQAADEGGGPNGIKSTTEVLLTLLDINDNAPFLTNAQPVVWYENQPKGDIVILTANDNDSEENGAPFTFALNSSASGEIRNKFSINGNILQAKVTFDREETKEYFLPIDITDNGRPPLTGVSILHVVIGDRNDNKMKEGHSDIFVYNFRGEAPDTEIGRVYVTDPDDWDLPDKSFTWLNYDEKSYYFDVNDGTGMITMKEKTPNGTYPLTFNVTERIRNERHSVTATVNVTVKEIPEEAVDKSGSIRFVGSTGMDFITVLKNGQSKKDILHHQLSLILNATMENVDIFTINSTMVDDKSYLDVRFSAHGSPYYPAEKMNFLVSDHQTELEALLGMKIKMISIDECLYEKVQCEASCRNNLVKSRVPLSVYTNKTSFIGVRALVEAECTCEINEPLVCLNGGTPFSDRCECPPSFDGPRCELTSIGFHGDGWALYPTLPACAEGRLSVTVVPTSENGLIFYVGPLRYNPELDVQDFMSLELLDGYFVLLINYGSGTTRLRHKNQPVEIGKPHLVEVVLLRTGIEMFVNQCTLSSCLNLAAPVGGNQFLNVNGPLQVGGTKVNMHELGQKFKWNHIPMKKGFQGCISKFTYNDETYDLGQPSDSMNVDPGCQYGTAKAVSFGIDTSFLVALLVCIAILLILLLGVVVHKRRSERWAEKELDDIRENIINYEDEGGGEGDAGYDLHVLRQMYDPPEKERDLLRNQAPSMNGGLVPDISGFLDDKKDVIDRDPDTNPFDDVRHYAYEGDGNTTGSLSSLASCTDEGDLKFNYLSSFGPRFRKLADMYGEVPSDEDESQAPGEESWC